MKVWSPKSDIQVLFKVENLADGQNVFHEVQATTTTSGEWEELTFDYSGINTDNTYGRIVVFFDFGVNGDGSDYYFDDIRLEP